MDLDDHVFLTLWLVHSQERTTAFGHPFRKASLDEENHEPPEDKVDSLHDHVKRVVFPVIHIWADVSSITNREVPCLR